MPVPTQDVLSNAQAVSIDDQLHAKTGARYLKKGVTDASDPNAMARYQTSLKHALDLIGELCGAAVINKGGLNVGVYPLAYRIGATEYSYAGVNSTAMPASKTTHLYVDTDQTLKTLEAAWPVTDHYKIAIVVTDGSAVTAITDCRYRNFSIGGTNNWFNVVPTANVDMDGFGFIDVGRFQLEDAVELTINAGAIDIDASAAVKQSFYRIDTEADAAADDLTTITGGAIGSIIVLRLENAARNVVVKHDATKLLWAAQDLTLDLTTDEVVLMKITSTVWVQIGGTSLPLKQLNQDLNCNNRALSAIGRLGLGFGSPLTIAAGAITVTRPIHDLDGEGSLPDDLVTINGGTAGDCIILRATIDGITVKQTGNISSAGEVVLNTDECIELWFDGFFWRVPGRNWRLDNLLNTGEVIPYDIGPFSFAGTPSTGVQNTPFWVCTVPCTILRFRGYARTAPSGGALVIRPRKNFANIYASDVNAINIANGTNADDSALQATSFVAGDILDFDIASVNAAANVVVCADARVTAKAAV